MTNDIPINIKPIIGYMQWYLMAPRHKPGSKRGTDTVQLSADDVLQLAMDKVEFAGTSIEDFQQALAIAQLNAAASIIAQSAEGSSYQVG